MLGERQMIGNQAPDAAGILEASLPSSLKSGLERHRVAPSEITPGEVENRLLPVVAPERMTLR